MTNPVRIMIDMETTAALCSPDAGILSLGACTFGLPFGTPRQEFYMRASLSSNEKLGRKIDKSTMEWWDKNVSPEIRAEAFGGTAAVDDVLDGFKDWCGKWVTGHTFKAGNSVRDLTEVELWSRGAGFDCEILQHAFYQIFGSYPFDFRKHMCQRTVERLMPQGLKLGRGGVHMQHHALEDAKAQADLMDIALRNLNWSGIVGRFE